MLIAEAVALAAQKNSSRNGVCLIGFITYPTGNQLPMPLVFKLIMQARKAILEISTI
ncbi:hypothetical protein [Coleofasciculus sp. FACHB-1120]|uniref:hypothetical protein n=1 Tax=Coleofasciculus sp. FACHB-1120 TaxID=2692783 RepID=UPI0016880F5D|nr:hypothetical protein [Coleofasciculus sp. FACHB-1120]MBD2741915.1 hypothetical protein [Coleofasciculus sp. FACHB-1120]